jgi:hypothetical protein
VNDYGQVVGALVADLAGADIPTTVAVRWRSSGRFTATYSDNTWARAVENHGWVVGFGGSPADESRNVYPILWRGGRVTKLPLGTNDFGGAAVDINESGMIAGYAIINGERSRAVVWRLTN